TRFYAAEEYHQEYFRKNPDAAYCQAVVRPKVESFRKVRQTR
ncbi:MAG: peptide-methionine (S)-S-oxide reductase, partial [Alteraurantiacibacter sp.]|nr:peptide-methionine (S)-S-oxide reductase [Alteraurantiacibacter sp.]